MTTRFDEWSDAENQKQLHFGFESPAHAREWFGNEGLAQMRNEGFELTPVRAKRIWRSKSGRQVAFLPHESETLLQTKKYRSPYDEDMEKGGLPMPGASAHHHVVLPPGSTVGKGPSGAAGSVAAANKIKVQHSDGGQSWKQVESGMITSTDPSHHPTSSREPNGK